MVNYLAVSTDVSDLLERARVFYGLRFRTIFPNQFLIQQIRSKLPPCLLSSLILCTLVFTVCREYLAASFAHTI